MGKAAAKQTASDMQYRRKKITMEIVKLEVGDTLVGRFVAQTERDWTDKATGEVKPLKTLVFENPQTLERQGLFADAGLLLAFEQAIVAQGDLIEIVKLDKAKLANGRTVNQYDIYALEDPSRPAANRPAAPHVGAAHA